MSVARCGIFAEALDVEEWLWPHREHCVHLWKGLSEGKLVWEKTTRLKTNLCIYIYICIYYINVYEKYK